MKELIHKFDILNQIIDDHDFSEEELDVILEIRGIIAYKIVDLVKISKE